MDTLFEPINWGMGEIRWFKRAEGERARTIEAHAAQQARGIYAWLTRHLGTQSWFGGESFGWADLSVVPYLNGARGNGSSDPDKNSPLGQWLARANARPSVQKAAKRRRRIRWSLQMTQVRGRGAERHVQARIPRSSPGMDDPLRRPRRRAGRPEKQQHPLLERVELTP